MKKILLLSTGGTIACVPGKNRLEPKLQAGDLIKYIQRKDSLCGIDCKTLFSLDSTNIQPEEWKIIADEAYDGLEKYDGVVITHGTDTMAYTASMLSFMIRNPGKPIVITGSQLPIAVRDSDGPRNLTDALLAASYGAGGVYVVFNGKIIRGCRAVKVRSTGFDAFESINAPYAGFIKGGRVLMGRSEARLPGHPQTNTAPKDTGIIPDVFLLKLIPGTNPVIFDSILEMGCKGVVVEGFGLGGLHYLRRDLILKVRRLVDAGVAVVVTSQCLYEMSDLSVYEVGGRLLEEGVIPGRDMTSEAAVTKLMWILGHTSDYAEIKRLVLTDFCGEIAM